MLPGLYDFQLSLKIVLLFHQLDPETTVGAEYPCRRIFLGTNRRINICRIFIQLMSSISASDAGC